MLPIDGKVMFEVAPRFSGKMAERQAEIIKEAGQVLRATLEAYEIHTRLRIAHFLGQTCHESAGFRTMPAEPALSLRIACEYWKRRKLNADCDRDDIRTTTRKINGGLNDLEDRSNYIRKAKEALARIEGIQLTGAVQDPGPVLGRGSTGGAVGDLKKLLQKLNFRSPSIRISARRRSSRSCAFRATRS